MKNKIPIPMIAPLAMFRTSMGRYEKQPCCCEEKPAKAKGQHIVLKQETVFVYTIDESGKTTRVTTFINYQPKGQQLPAITNDRT